jgi:hypothetical protein
MSLIKGEVVTETDMDLSILNIQDQTMDLSYESHRPLDLMGTLAYLIALYFLRVFLYFAVVKPVAHFFPKARGYQMKLAKSLFFAEILLLLIEGYLEFVITCYLKSLD